MWTHMGLQGKPKPMEGISEGIQFHIVFIWVDLSLHSTDRAWVFTLLILLHIALIWLYLRLLLGTLHSFNFRLQWCLHSDFTREQFQWTLLENNSNELYQNKSRNFTRTIFFWRVRKMVLGSPPVNFMWDCENIPMNFWSMQSYKNSVFSSEIKEQSLKFTMHFWCTFKRFMNS